jgi:hypothetical protein
MFENSLVSGKYSKRFVQGRVPNLLSVVRFETGLYVKHDIPLFECLKFHRTRWTNIQQAAANISKSFLMQLSKRCLSMTEIIIVSMLMKLRYFVGDISDDIYDRCMNLEVPHYNKSLEWFRILDAVVNVTQNPGRITCPELCAIFKEMLDFIFEAIQKTPDIFEQQLNLLQTLFQSDWKDLNLTNEEKQHICFGGLHPRVFARNNNHVLRVLTFYRDFENGNFEEVTTLLLSIQITIRVSQILQTLEDRYTLNPIECQEQLSGIQLVRIVQVMNKDPLFALFNYPKSFIGGKKPFVHCEVMIEKQSFFVVLELAILFAIFKNTHQNVIMSALRKFLVDKKKKAFQNPNGETIMYKGVSMPKRWLRFAIFKEMMKKKPNN